MKIELEWNSDILPRLIAAFLSYSTGGVCITDQTPCLGVETHARIYVKPCARYQIYTDNMKQVHFLTDWDGKFFFEMKSLDSESCILNNGIMTYIMWIIDTWHNLVSLHGCS